METATTPDINFNPKLETIFRHHNWFVDGKTTKKEALKYFAYSGDFILDDKPVIKRNQTVNLFEELPKKSILRYCGKERGSYNISDYEISYFVFLKLVVKEYNHILADIFTRYHKEEREKSEQGKFYYKDHKQLEYKYYFIKKKCIEGLREFHGDQMTDQLLDLLDYRNYDLLKNCVKEYNLKAS